MRYNLSRISEFLQTHAEELENIGLGDCETKNISDKIKSIILFYQENKERVLKYDPQLEGVFNAAIDTIKKTESGKKVMDLSQYFGHKKVKFLSHLSSKLLTFFRC